MPFCHQSHTEMFICSLCPSGHHRRSLRFTAPPSIKLTLHLSPGCVCFPLLPASWLSPPIHTGSDEIITFTCINSSGLKNKQSYETCFVSVIDVKLIV